MTIQPRHNGVKGRTNGCIQSLAELRCRFSPALSPRGIEPPGCQCPDNRPSKRQRRAPQTHRVTFCQIWLNILIGKTTLFCYHALIYSAQVNEPNIQHCWVMTLGARCPESESVHKVGKGEYHLPAEKYFVTVRSSSAHARLRKQSSNSSCPIDCSE